MYGFSREFSVILLVIFCSLLTLLLDRRISFICRRYERVLDGKCAHTTDLKAANLIMKSNTIRAAPSNDADFLDGFLAERSDSPACSFFRLLPESDVLVYPFSEHPKHAEPGDPVATVRLELDGIIRTTVPTSHAEGTQLSNSSGFKSSLFLAASTLSMTSSFSWRAHSVLVLANSEAHRRYCLKWSDRELPLEGNELLCRDSEGQWVFPTQMEVHGNSGGTLGRVYPHTMSLAVMGDVDFTHGRTDVTYGSRLRSNNSVCD